MLWRYAKSCLSLWPWESGAVCRIMSGSCETSFPVFGRNMNSKRLHIIDEFELKLWPQFWPQLANYIVDIFQQMLQTEIYDGWVGDIIATYFSELRRWHSRGQRFDPAYLHHKMTSNRLIWGHFSFSFELMTNFEMGVELYSEQLSEQKTDFSRISFIIPLAFSCSDFCKCV